MEIKLIPIEKLKRDKKQPRQTFDEEKIRGMAQSIVTEGIINPIEVDKNFVIITGELRSRAAKVAGLKEVPCKVISINEKERFRRQVIENIHHNTMTDWDTAKALSKLLKELPIVPGTIGTHGGKPNQGFSALGKIIGKPETYVREKFEILNSSEQFREAVQKGLSGTFIRAIKATPPEYKGVMEKKIIAGDFENRDFAVQTAYALQRSPEKASQILKVSNEDQLYRISPRAHEVVKARLKPTTEFMVIQKQLLKWLKSNPPETIVHKDRFLTILGMSNLVDKLNEWGKKAQHKQLT